MRVHAGPEHDPAEDLRPATGSVRSRSVGGTVRAYLALTKPRVLELLLVTTVPVMILAARGFPDVWLILGTVIGGAMSAGAAAAFNMYLERGIDARMDRTKNRPLVTGAVTPGGALRFAWTLAVGSVLLLAATTNILTAILAAAAMFFYVVIYTLLLKPRTEQNIVWGGIAGCFPVLIGWTAVTGSLDWPPLVLFLLVFFWTPAHYWPLSIKYQNDYRAAGIPMLGATRPARTVARRITAYAWATAACAIVLIPVAGMGLLYSVTAALVTGWFILEAHRLHARTRGSRPAEPMRVFHASITSLTLLFLAIAIDPLLPI